MINPIAEGSYSYRYYDFYHKMYASKLWRKFEMRGSSYVVLETFTMLDNHLRFHPVSGYATFLRFLDYNIACEFAGLLVTYPCLVSALYPQA